MTRTSAPTPPRLRLATPDDLEVLVELMTEFYAESGYALDRGAARAALLELAVDPALGRLWLIQSSGEPVGYVAMTLGFSLEYCGRDAFIDDLFIRPGYRGRGLGSAALESVERAGRELGVRALHLEVERTNRAGRALYAKRGFQDNERQLLSKRLDPRAGSTRDPG